MMREIIKPLFKNFYFLVFIVCAVALLLNFRFLYFAGGDQAIYLMPDKTLRYLLSSWDENVNSALGGKAYASGILMPFFAFFKLTSVLPDTLSEYLYFLAIFVGIFFSGFYFFHNYLFGRKGTPALVASLLYISNIFFFANFVNYNIHLTFILFPLLLSLCHELVSGNLRKVIIFSVLCSIILPSICINPPTAVPPIIFSLFYIFYLLLESHELNKVSIRIAVSFFVFLFLNLWWIYPYFLSVNSFGDLVQGFSGVFKTQSLQEVFRFGGGWGFDRYYLGFDKGRADSLYVYNPIFIVSSFTPVFLAFCAMFFKNGRRKTLIFFFGALLGIILSKGILPPFGALYLLFLKTIPYFSIFREPYTKFAILTVMSVSALLGFFVLRLEDKIGYRGYKRIVFMLISLLFVNMLPFIFGGFIPARYSAGPIKSYLIKIPEYLKEFEKDSKSEESLFRTMAFPDVYGGRSYNWISGFSSGDASFKYFSSQPVVSYRIDGRSLDVDSTVKNAYYSFRYNDKAFVNYLRLLNVKKIVQENDLDFRWLNYPSDKYPLLMKSVFLGLENSGYLEKEKSYGFFSHGYIQEIPNDIPYFYPQGVKISEKEREVYKKTIEKELLDQPALATYNLKSDYLLPLIYSPKRLVYTPNPHISMPYILSLMDPKISLAYASDPALLPKSQEIYVGTERKYRKVLLDDLSWDSGWAWPSVSINPKDSLKYRLLGLREFAEIFLVKNNLDKLDVHLWLASKAVSEIETFSPSESIALEIIENKYTFHFNAIMKILKQTSPGDRDDDFWAMVSKVSKYLKKSVAFFEKRGASKSFDVLSSSYRDFYNWVSENGYPYCGDYCYEISVPEKGEYEILIDKQNIEKVTGVGVEWRNRINLVQENNPKDAVEIDLSNAREIDENWYGVGAAKFEVGKYFLNFNLNDTVEVSSKEWELVPNVQSSEGRLLIQSQSSFFDFEHGGFVLSNIVKNYVGDRDYKISFSFSSADPRMQVAVLEEVRDYTLGAENYFNKLNFRVPVESEGARDDCEEEYCYTFEKSFRSSVGAKGAHVYIFYDTGAGFFSDQKVKDFSVKEILNPNILLKTDRSLTDNINTPEVSYRKESSTLYKVLVKNFQDKPLYLVFGQPFDNGWKMSLRSNFGEISIPKDHHFLANGFGNLWLIDEPELVNADTLELTIEYVPQKIFVFTIYLGFVALAASVVFYLWLKKYSIKY